MSWLRRLTQVMERKCFDSVINKQSGILPRNLIVFTLEMKKIIIASECNYLYSSFPLDNTA